MRTFRLLSPFVAGPLVPVLVATMFPARAWAAESEHSEERLSAAAPTTEVAPSASHDQAPRTEIARAGAIEPAAVVQTSATQTLAAVSTGEPTEKSGVSAQAISTPQGAGKMGGMGESFTMQLSTGTAALAIPISVPAGRGGEQPALSVSYSSSGGRGVAGQGFGVTTSFIARQTDRGIPAYADPATGQGFVLGQDRFVTGEGHELVPICQVSAGGTCDGAQPGESMPSWAAGWQYFRTAIESSFARYFWSPDHQTWREQTRDGHSFELGVPLDGSGDTNALESDPLQPSHMFKWNLSRTYDAHGDVNLAPGIPVHPRNAVRYRYLAKAGISYLSDTYDTPPASSGEAAPLAQWAHHTHLTYENRPDPSTSYRRGYASTDSQRLVGIDVASKSFVGDVGSPRELLRRYHFAYDATYHVSLLTQIQTEGRCASPIPEDTNGLLPSATGCPTLPPLKLEYAHVPGASDLAGYEPFDETPHAFAGSPKYTLDAQRADLFDVNADGLPDVLITDVSTYGAQLGIALSGTAGTADSFTAGTASVAGVLNGTSVSLALSSPNVVPIDIDGNGLVDLLQIPKARSYAAYAPTLASGAWVFQGRVITTADAQSTLIDFTNNAKLTKALDVDGDGLLDFVVNNGDAYQTFFGLGRYAGGDGQFGTAAWTSATQATISTQQPVSKCVPWSSQSVQLGQVDQKIGDLNGDGLPDIVRVRPNDVRYWPGRGNGFWGTGRSDDCPKGTISSGREIAMAASPTFAGDAGSTMRLRDLNGDGLDDLIQIRSDAIDVWLNVDGAGFTTRPHTIHTSTLSPTLQANSRMRFSDLNGSGTIDLVWGEGYNYKYVDLAAGQRPWLLTRLSNGIGKTTDIEYGSSTTLMLAARKAGQPWASNTPMPIHVITRMVESDHLSATGRPGGQYERRYTYRDPVYDGRQREFRGFRSVQEIAQGAAGTPSSTTETHYLLGECVPDRGDTLDSPCTSQGRWRSNPREALKGQAVLTEKQDDSGHYLSTDHTTYRLRRLYTGLDGRDVRHVFAARSDHYLYDVASFAPSPSSLAVDDVELEIGSITASDAGTVTARAAYAHLRTENDTDVFGNATTQVDSGCVEGCASIDEVLTTTAGSSLVPGDLSGWHYRTIEKSTRGGAHPGVAYRHTRSTYDAAGDLVATESEITGTLPLDRHHEDPAQSIASAPANGSQDGWVTSSTSQFDAFGNPVGTRTATGHCHQITYDSAYSQLAVNESVLVGPAGLDGCGTIALGATGVYDRGLGAPTLSLNVHGELTTAVYDGFGRTLEIRRPDPTLIGLSDAYPSQTFEYVEPVDATLTPWSAVHITTHDAEKVDAPGTTESWSFTDGMGRTLGELHTADLRSGDLAPWIASKVTDYDQGGQPRHVERAFFYTGAPLDFPVQSAARTAPTNEVRYDAFERDVEHYAFDGGLVTRSLYHAMSIDTLDAVDAIADASSSTPATVLKDGHGRSIASTERLRAAGGVEARTIRTSFSPAGDVESMTRVTDSGAPPVVRWMAYDSLGRRVLNVEPNTSKGARAWRYAYDDDGQIAGTSDARGCGANYTYDSAGRLVGEDYSPCLTTQAAYTPADPTSGAGYEVLYRFDAPSPDAPLGFAGSFLLGRLSAISDRASQTLSSYDGRGRLIAAARRVAAPDGSGYTSRWYVQTTEYDSLDRPVAGATGAASSEILGADGTSVVRTHYARNGEVASVDGSYGVLVGSIVRDPKGLLLSAMLGDAAATTTTNTYDPRDRLLHAEAKRAAPGLWSASDASYAPAPISTDSPTTLQLLLQSTDITYDTLDRPIAIHDGRDPAEWPAGAKPVDRTMRYDDLGRVVRTDYAYAAGTDDWTSPAAREENDDAVIEAMPRVSFDKRPLWQSYTYDSLGNVTSATDDASGFFDRSLGTATHGTPAAGPDQLQAASDPSPVRGGSLGAAYDDAGNMIGLVVRRGGGCLPVGAVCTHRFVYDWDEIGRLVRARRWDLDAPGAPASPPPRAWPNADLHYTYDAADLRTLKSATDMNGIQRHTVYVFSTLELRQTTFTEGDYVRDATTEVASLFAHGVRLGEVNLQPSDVPTTSSGRRHVFLRLADSLGSTGAMLDKDTGELVERTTYMPFGARESDYRPARWDAYRAPYGFTGKEEDVEVGLSYFGKRYLAPSLMRWISPDPLAVHGLGADMNVYAYVHGRVFVATDPTGLEEKGGESNVPSAAAAAASVATPDNWVPEVTLKGGEPASGTLHLWSGQGEQEAIKLSEAGNGFHIAQTELHVQASAEAASLGKDAPWALQRPMWGKYSQQLVQRQVLNGGAVQSHGLFPPQPSYAHPNPAEWAKGTVQHEFELPAVKLSAGIASGLHLFSGVLGAGAGFYTAAQGGHENVANGIIDVALGTGEGISALGFFAEAWQAAGGGSGVFLGACGFGMKVFGGLGLFHAALSGAAFAIDNVQAAGIAARGESYPNPMGMPSPPTDGGVP